MEPVDLINATAERMLTCAMTFLISAPKMRLNSSMSGPSDIHAERAIHYPDLSTPPVTGSALGLMRENASGAVQVALQLHGNRGADLNLDDETKKKLCQSPPAIVLGESSGVSAKRP
jgi:hypothetical protein